MHDGAACSTRQRRCRPDFWGARTRNVCCNSAEACYCQHIHTPYQRTNQLSLGVTSHAHRHAVPWRGLLQAHESVMGIHSVGKTAFEHAED